MKRFLSIFLAFLMICTMLPMSAVSAFAEDIDGRKIEYVDPEIYFAQCMAGVAKDEKSDSAVRCNNLYNYYINENIYSPTQSFLDSCYENKSLMKEYDIWKSSSLAADPSSAVKMVMKKEDYYQSLIIAMYSKATAENNAFQEVLKNKVINQSKSIISSLCEIKKITDVSQIVDAVDITDPETVIALEKCVSATYSLATVKKVNGVIGDILSYGKDILDVVDRLAVYGSMVELDEATKLWLNQMYDSCTADTDGELKSALKTLTLASTDFAGAALADVKEAAFTLTKWGVKATVNVGMAGLVAGNPALAAVFAGLKLGKTVCNIFFATDDVCEQLFTIECIYDVQDLSRRVAEACKNTFIGEQTIENAKSFLYAVDCYYESIIKIDIDCMESFLDKLYNGGILNGFIKWIWGATDDYQECIDTLEGLRDARINNYNNMHTYFKIALQVNYPETYELYFTPKDTVKVTGLYFPTTRIFPTGYPANYANLLVGEFFNINVMYTPRNTTQTGFVATSDNTDVVRIEGNVMVGVSEGTANVTVTSTEDPFVFYTAEIVVKNRLEDVETGGSVRNRFKYTVENGEATITGFSDGYEPSSLYIPEKINGYPVTSIGYLAFEDCIFLTSVTIPNSVTNIDSCAFLECSSLTNINIPNSVTSIGREAFRNCLSLTNVIIPGSVMSIGYGAFTGCLLLENIEVSDNSIAYCSENGVLFDKRKTELIQYPEGKADAVYQLPDSVKKIKSSAFSGSASITNVIIPDSVTDIESYAFSSCNSLTNISISNNVTNIGVYTFAFCESLARIIIPDSVTNIGDCAFESCRSLISISIPNSVTNIGERAFYGCASLTSINIPNSVTSIGREAFHGCASLTSINIPNNVTSIGYEAFACCISLTSVNVNSGNVNYKSIDGVLFSKDGTNLICYPGGKAEIYSIPDCVTSIGESAFCACASLTSITIPDSVTSIGADAFAYCLSLTSINIPDSVTSISDNTFRYCRSLTNLTIPNSVTSIGNLAFFNCTSLESTTIPDSVTSIGAGAFAACESLTSVIIPDSVTSIDDMTFSGCSSLISITIPDSVTSIGAVAFAACESLTSITIPDSVTSIGDGAFEGCTSLSNTIIPDNVAEIGMYAFANCPSLTSITLPDSVTNIGTYAFGYYSEDNETIKKVDGFTIFGTKGSAAETYAVDNGFIFIPIQNFEDTDSGISVTVPSDTLDPNTELKVSTIETTETAVTYDISLAVDGKEIQPNGKVTVKIPVPASMNGTACKVYRQETDGTYTDMNAVYQDGYMVSTTDHFSVYVLTTDNPNVLLGDTNADGVIDDWDSVLLDRCLAGWEVEINTSAADIDGNGIVDDWDGVLLARKLAGWN